MAPLNSGVSPRKNPVATGSQKQPPSPRRRLVTKSLLVGLTITVATYLAALACAAAQLHSAAVFLAWPTFVLTGLMPPGEPVTSGSPSDPWWPLATVGVAWLIYSSLCYYWLGRRRAAGA